MEALSITPRYHGEAYVISLDGAANNETSGMLEQTLMEGARAGKKMVIVDASGLLKVTSAGLRSLLNGARAIDSAGGRMVLASLQPKVIQVLGLTGLLKVFKTAPTVQEALQASAPPA